METLNAPKHPQVVFAGFDPDDPRLHAMQQLVGASVLIDIHAGTSRLRKKDWDALVIEGSLGRFSIGSHWQVLAFASVLDDIVGGWSATGRHNAPVEAAPPQPSPTLRLVRENLPSGAAGALFNSETLRILKDTTPPVPRLRGLTTTTGDPDHRVPIGRGASSPRPGCRPVLLDADGFFVAGEFPLAATVSAQTNRSTDPWCWYLPHRSEHPETWLAYLLSVWNDRDPVRFPTAHSWRTRQEWMSGDELAAAQERDRVEVARTEAIKRFDQEAADADAALTNASAAAESGERRLLTGQGDQLVAAVIDALVELGFEVVNADQERQEGEAKAEDLDITDPDQPTTTVIAEVKGYGSGAKSRDLQQISQHARRYQQRTSAFPDRSWYIVNQYRSDDPAGRPTLLGGSDENVSVFAEDGGLVIDTRDLWRLLREVRHGALDPVRVRAHLLTSTGMLDGADLLSTTNDAG